MSDGNFDLDEEESSNEILEEVEVPGTASKKVDKVETTSSLENLLA